MRRRLIVANWKMHGTLASISALLASVKRDLPLSDLYDVVFCPSHIYIPAVAEALSESSICWGGQDCAAEHEGAFTGEVAANMLADLGCQFVIVGHSERRALYGESDDVVANKFVQAQLAELTPVLCVGETLQQRHSGETLGVVESQLQAVIERSGVDSFAGAVVAYEPVWAIGTGETATPQQAQEVHAHLRKYIGAINADIASNLRILYGGSVKANNAEALFAQSDIDGGLVGGASLDAGEFVAIGAAAAKL